MVASTLSRGDVAIIAVNTEDNGNPQLDLISFVLLRPVGSGTVISFTDRAWSGAAFAGAGGGDGTFTYTAATDLPAGTVVQITQAQLNAAGINLSDAGDTLYAYQGATADTPSLFLHAVDIADGTAGFDGTELTNTGLVSGTSAVALGTGAGISDIDNAEYAGRTHNIQVADLFARINTASAWATNANSPQDGNAAGAPISTAPDFVLIGGGAGAGEGIVTIHLDGTFNAGTLGYQIEQAFQNDPGLFSPNDITLDTVRGLYFFVDSDANGNNRIIQGSIDQLLNNPGGTPAHTILYSNASTGANGVIQSIAVDTANQRIYFDIGTPGSGSTFNRINYNNTSQTPTVLATLGADRYVTQLAIDFTRGTVFLASSQIDSVFGSDAIFQNYIYRASAGSAAALATAAAGSLTFTTLPFAPDDSGVAGEGGPLPGEAFPVELGNVRGMDVDPVSNTLFFTTGSVILDNDGNGNTTYTGGIYRYALDSNPTGTYTELYRQTGTPGAAGTGPRGLLYHLEVDATTGRYYVSDESGLNGVVGDGAIWSGSLTTPGTPTFLATVGNINGLGGRGFEIQHAPTLSGAALGASLVEQPGLPSGLPTAVAVAGSFVGADVNNTTQVAGAQVRISGGFQSGVIAQDTLSINGSLPGGVVASYDGVLGVLTLSGIATIGDYQQALSQVVFTVSGDNPTNFGTATTRTLAYSLFDGLLYSDEVTATVAVTGVNDAPVLNGLLGDLLTTTETAGTGSTLPAVKIDFGGNATITDIDNLNFNGGSIRFAITAGRNSAQDQLNIDTAAATTVTVAAGVVSVGGTAIGTVTGGGAGGADLVVTLNANATPTLVQTLVRAIEFANTGGDNPTAGARTITTTLIDGAGTANSGTDTWTVTSTVNVVAINDAPTITGFPAVGTYSPGVASNVNLSPTTIADVDSSTLTATIQAFGAVGSFTAAAGAGVTLGGSGTTLTVTGTATAINTYLDTVSNIQFTPSGNGTFNIFLNASDGVAVTPNSQAGVSSTFTPISIAGFAAPITQNFDALLNSGGGMTPVGWTFAETGSSSNTSYGAGTGSSNAGDTYSFGAAASTERAFGTLRSGNVIPVLGGAFANNSGSTLTSLLISYIGEQWRNGGANLVDRLDFQISTDATSLSTGTWTDVNALDFSSPIVSATVGALDGNLTANRTAISTEITGLSIAAGSTFWIRWTDLDVTGTDTGLAIDDFSLTARSVAANADTGTVNENATITGGNLFANDTNLGGGTLVVSQVNGVAGNVGTQITLASGALLTVNANGTYAYNPNGVFNYLVDPSVAAATGATSGSATDSFTYTLSGGQTATVTVTINGVASADDELRGDGGNNTLNGTPLNDFYNLSQGGNDSVSGGAGDDAFLFGATFTAADTVDGGSGTNDQVGIGGNYAGGNALVLNANTLTNVEVLALLPGAGNSYAITSNDGNVAAGQQLTIFAGNLGAGENFTFNGSAETDGSFLTYGGLGTDTITGGAQSDGFYFGPGKWQTGDSVVGGGGANDQLALDGDYSITIGASADVETLVLLAGPAGTPNNFNITLSDAWTSGEARTVFGRNVTTALTINGAAETNGSLTLFGGFGSDTLTGGAVDDTIYGLEGNDAITGGLGSDTAVYQGQRASYSVVTGGGNVQIVDNDAVADGNDGTDTVVGIEFARFADQTISITSPIILDLDGGGVTTLSAANSNARFDMDGDGIGDDTSWFGRGEGLLFLDRDGNGTLSDAGEMSFTNDVANARSDLEGLAAYDSNGDGQLSAADGRFASFKIWRDRDGDGVVDRREIMTLRQARVRSLSLSGTATSGSYALGDTAIVNTGSFTRTNGRRGGLVDAVLTAVSSKDATARAGQQSGTAPAIDRGLFTGSFSDAVAQLDPTPGEQRGQPSLTATERDAGDIALATATALTVIDDYGNWLKPDSNPGLSLDATLDQRVLLMAQDMASFGATTTSADTDRWRREGSTSAGVEMFAA